MFKYFYHYKTLSVLNIVIAFFTALVYVIGLSVLMIFLYNVFEGYFYFNTGELIFEVLIWIGISVILTIIFVILNTLGTYYSVKLNENISLDLRFEIINKINFLNYQLINTNDDNINSMLSNDVVQLSDNFYGNFFNIFLYSFISLFSLLVLFILNWILFILCLVLYVINFVIIYFFRQYSKRTGEIYNQKTQDYSNATKTLLEGINTLFFTNKLRLLSDLLLVKLNQDIKKANVIRTARRSYSDVITNIVAFTSENIALFIAAIILINQNLLINENINYIGYNNVTTIGALLGTVSVANNLFRASIETATALNKYNLCKPVYQKIQNFKTSFDNRNELQESLINFDVKNMDYVINEKQIFNNFNLSLKANKKYAFVGPSGCGKSTLARLLCGLLPTTKGDIYINQNNLNDYSTKSVLNKIGYIEAIPFILTDTVKNNITLCANQVDEAKYQKIIKLLNLQSIDNDLIIDEIENDLSVGQKQRINFARYLYNDYQFFILDEATSNVDRQTADLIEEYLLNNKNTTLINITHHLNKEHTKKYHQIIDLSFNVNK